jgi:hypothetical protein
MLKYILIIFLPLLFGGCAFERVYRIEIEHRDVRVAVDLRD